MISFIDEHRGVFEVEPLSPEPPMVKAAAHPEIVVGPGTIRLQEGASTSRIAA